MTQTCSTCRWSKEFNIGSIEYKWHETLREMWPERVDHFILRCHKALPASDGFPQVQPDDFCGEWTAGEGTRVDRTRSPVWPNANGVRIEPNQDTWIMNDAPSSEGWIPWAGGECPVAEDTFGMVRFRDGLKGEFLLRFLGWDHTGHALDIIAYRVHKPADFRLEAGKYYITATGERVGPMELYKAFRGFWAEGSSGWWDKYGAGRATENGSVPDIVALAADQESKP